MSGWWRWCDWCRRWRRWGGAACWRRVPPCCVWRLVAARRGVCRLRLCVAWRLVALRGVAAKACSLSHFYISSPRNCYRQHPVIASTTVAYPPHVPRSMCPPLVVLLRSDAEFFCLSRSAQLLPSLPSALCSDASGEGSDSEEIRPDPSPFANSAPPFPSVLSMLRSDACFPARYRPFLGLSVSALHAPLRRFGRGLRAQKKFARTLSLRLLRSAFSVSAVCAPLHACFPACNRPFLGLRVGVIHSSGPI